MFLLVNIKCIEHHVASMLQPVAILKVLHYYAKYACSKQAKVTIKKTPLWSQNWIR